MLAALATSLVAPHRAAAGSWSVSYECSGDLKGYPWHGSIEVYDANGYWIPKWHTTASPFYDVTVEVNDGDQGLDHECSSVGDVTATCHWNSSGPGDNPPAKLLVRQFSTVIAFGTGGGPFSSADNGLGDSSGNGNVSSGTHDQMITTNGRTVIVLPKCHLSATVNCDDYWVHDGIFEEAITDYHVEFPNTPDKSIMIAGSGTQENSGSQWTGKGDTRFSNDVAVSDGFSMNVAKLGDDFGPVHWDGELLGSPWPEFAHHQAGWFTRNWNWMGAGSDPGDTFLIHRLDTDRPHVRWPYSPTSGTAPRDLLEQMDSPRVPPTQQQQETLSLTDVDSTGEHPEWNFNGTAQYTLTFHNEYELIHADPSVTVPPSENPWGKLLFNGTNSDIQTPGRFDNWSPTIYYEAGDQWDFHVNGAWWSGGGGGTTNQGMNASPPPTSVPLGARGVVFGRPSLIRIRFTYNHFLVGGREIPPLNPDGSEHPFESQVVRPRGGFGTHDIDLKVFTFGENDPYPGSINHD